MTRNPDLSENSAEAAIPVGTNNAGGIAPQASTAIGTPAPPPQTIESVGCAQAVTCLNPYGPVDRMSEGAIVFDLPQLAYSQFLDIDQQFEITDDMSPGSVILQIPYHPISDYTNPFMKMYASFHSRYNGDLIFRMQMIGNATYSGTLMWFWYPTRYPSSIVTFAEAQKYEYKTMSVVMPSVEAFIHRDARQYQYYREMSDGDVASRPHLVLCIHTTVVSPLREGIKVRMRIGSKFASLTDARVMGAPVQPFRLANPVLSEIHPDNKVKSLNDMTIGQVFPYFNRRKLYGLIDGNSSLPSLSYVDPVGNILDFSLRMPIPCLFGGDLPQGIYKRLFLSNTTYSTTGIDKVRIVVVLHQLDLATEKAIATDADFTNITKDETTWLALFDNAAAIQKYVTVDVMRKQSAELAVWTNPDETTNVLKVVRQLHMVTRKGMVVALALEYHASSRDFDSAKKIGIPNNASGVDSTIPFSPVLGPVVHLGTLKTLPVPWFSFKFTDSPTTIVTSNDENAPTTITNPTILDYFGLVTQDTTAEQAFQFDLVDPTSKVRVMTLRYLPTFQDFVINASDSIKYREYQGDITKLLITNAGNIPLATSMPKTDTSSWPKRFPETSNLVSSTSTLSQFRPNAAAALAIGEMAEAGATLGAEMETSFGSLFSRAGAEGISETSVTGATDPISRSLFKPTVFVNSEGRMYPAAGATNIYGKRSYGTLTNNMYTFSRGQQTELTNTSEGTQAGPSAANVREKFTQVYRPEQDKYTQVFRPESTHTVQTDNLYTGSRSTQTDPTTRSAGVNTSTQTSKNFAFEKSNSILDYYRHLSGGGTPDNFDRFLYLSSLNAMKPNGGAVIKGEYERAMQSNQNEWQSRQNDIQRQFQNQQQQQQFTHENEMQEHGFEQQEELQQRGFTHDTQMQSNEFNFKNQYQSKQFQHDTDMSNLGFEHDIALGKQHILGNLANTATGGVFSLAGTALSKVGDSYLQNQQYHNQQNLMTQQFNQSMFASGASSQALKLAA